MTVINKLINCIPLEIRIRIGQTIDKTRGFKFDGFGLKTVHEVPWNNPMNCHFNEVYTKTKTDFEFSGDGGCNEYNIDKLKWRNWMISFCAEYAVMFTRDNTSEFVECGSCDGLSAKITLETLKNMDVHKILHLYDAWAPMKRENLVERELHDEGNYSNINIDRIQKNLCKYNNVCYHKGYLPESLYGDSPLQISYLHIDLNSVKSTVGVLEYLYPYMLHNSIILFDDYGWGGYEQTKKGIDGFLKNKYGRLLNVPTGQAVFIVSDDNTSTPK